MRRAHLTHPGVLWEWRLRPRAGRDLQGWHCPPPASPHPSSVVKGALLSVSKDTHAADVSCSGECLAFLASLTTPDNAVAVKMRAWKTRCAEGQAVFWAAGDQPSVLLHMTPCSSHSSAWSQQRPRLPRGDTAAGPVCSFHTLSPISVQISWWLWETVPQLCWTHLLDLKTSLTVL